MPVCVCGRQYEPGESYCVRCGRHVSSAAVEPAPAAVETAPEPIAVPEEAAPPFAWAPPPVLAAHAVLPTAPVPAQPWPAQAWPAARPEHAPAPPHQRLTLALIVVMILTLVAVAGFVVSLRATAVTEQNRTQFLPPPVAAPSPTATPAPLAEVGAAALSRVVTIESQTDRGERFGTGWLIDASGDFVTNDHVITGEHGVRILDRSGKVHVATVMGTDISQDIAVVRSADGFAADPLPVAKEADVVVPQPVVVLASSRATEHGDTTTATLTRKHQSITVRPEQGDIGAPMVYEDMLLIDGKVIYQGNSGGPVIDGGGRVLGIITAASPSTPEGFAIPIVRVIEELRAFAARAAPGA